MSKTAALVINQPMLPKGSISTEPLVKNDSPQASDLLFKSTFDNETLTNCTPSAKRGRYGADAILTECNSDMKISNDSLSVLLGNVETLQNTLRDLSKLVGDIESSTSGLAEDTKLSLSRISGSVPAIMASLRRHYRVMTTQANKSTHSLTDIKLKHREVLQEIMDWNSQLANIHKRIRKEQTAVPIPKFLAVLSLLCDKEEFEESLKADLVTEHDPAILSDDSDNVQEPSTLEETDPEEFYLNWLRFDLACRSREAADIETVKLLRQSEEEKLKLLQKKEAELAAKLAPVEKEITKLITAINASAPNTTSSNSAPKISPLIFPAKAYSLCPPLFSLFTKFFSYKAVNADMALETRLVFQQTSKTTLPLYETSPGRLQVVIDKANIALPPPTYPKAAAWFPLSIRFCYFPKLNLISAVCQFPRVIGSDVTFLADLFCSNDDGTISPNPLHHITSDVSLLLPSSSPKSEIQACRNDAQQANSIESNDSSGVAKLIATRISELQLGRPYIWAQVLAGITFSVDSTSVSSTPTIPEKKLCDDITAGHFVKTFRIRASLRAWTLYIEESLKENPHVIPPPGVILPPALEASANTAASLYQSFSQSSLIEFLQAGGDPKGVTASQDRDVRFLKAIIICYGVTFQIFIATPLDSRNAEFCIQMKQFPTAASIKQYLVCPKLFSVWDYSVDSSMSECDSNLVYAALDRLTTEEQKSIRETAVHIDKNNQKIQQESTEIVSNNVKQKNDSDIPMPDIITNDFSKKADMRIRSLLTELLPGGNSSWIQLSQIMSGTVKPDISKKLTHFSEEGLSGIQHAIGITLPQTYESKDPETYTHIILIIQLVVLSSKLERWVRDVLSRGGIFRKPLRVQETPPGQRTPAETDDTMECPLSIMDGVLPQ